MPLMEKIFISKTTLEGLRTDDGYRNSTLSGTDYNGMWSQWKAIRAAMLQAEPVSNSDELPLDYLQGHKDGLEWAAQLAEANHPQTGDWLYDDPIDLARAIRKGPDMPTVQGGNSPVTPDGWISCSERMPEKGQNVLISVNFDSSLVEPLICSARYTGSTFRRGDATIKPGNGIEQATHWMPLPEPPLEAK